MEGCIGLNIVLLKGKKPRITVANYADMTNDERRQLEKIIENLATRLGKIQGADDPRCKDCRHWGHGRTTTHAVMRSEVCFLRLKSLKGNNPPEQRIYYARPRLSKPCDDFEKR